MNAGLAAITSCGLVLCALCDADHLPTTFISDLPNTLNTCSRGRQAMLNVEAGVERVTKRSRVGGGAVKLEKGVGLVVSEKIQDRGLER